MTGDATRIGINAYHCPVLVRKRVGEDRYLVVVDSSPGTGCEGLTSQEVFLTDGSDGIIWQINVPLAEHRKHNPGTPGGWPFVGLVERLGVTYAQRWDGGLFTMDDRTGDGAFAMWTK